MKSISPNINTAGFAASEMEGIVLAVVGFAFVRSIFSMGMSNFSCLTSRVKAVMSMMASVIITRHYSQYTRWTVCPGSGIGN